MAAALIILALFIWGFAVAIRYVWGHTIALGVAIWFGFLLLVYVYAFAAALASIAQMFLPGGKVFS